MSIRVNGMMVFAYEDVKAEIFSFLLILVPNDTCLAEGDQMSSCFILIFSHITVTKIHKLLLKAFIVNFITFHRSTNQTCKKQYLTTALGNKGFHFFVY